nr:hypothetical protein CFP56_01071 [Quercus suber]
MNYHGRTPWRGSACFSIAFLMRPRLSARCCCHSDLSIYRKAATTVPKHKNWDCGMGDQSFVSNFHFCPISPFVGIPQSHWEHQPPSHPLPDKLTSSIQLSIAGLKHSLARRRPMLWTRSTLKSHILA